MIPVDWIRMFSARELQLLISGDQRSALIIILLHDYYLICLSDHRLLLFQTLFQISDTFHSSEWFSTNFLLTFRAAYLPFDDFDFVRYISFLSLIILCQYLSSTFWRNCSIFLLMQPYFLNIYTYLIQI